MVMLNPSFLSYSILKASRRGGLRWMTGGSCTSRIRWYILKNFKSNAVVYLSHQEMLLCLLFRVETSFAFNSSQNN